MDTNNSTEQSANLDPVEAIADLLTGGEDSTEDKEPETDSPAVEAQDNNTDDIEDSEDAEKPSDESTEDDEVEQSEEVEEEEQTLHEMLGISEEQLTVDDEGEFLLNVKVDGKTSQHNLADVIKSYQLDKNNTQKAQQLAADRQSFETGLRERVQQVNSAIQQNQQLADVLQNELLSDYDKVNWDELRDYDPAEYAAKRQDYATKYQRVQRLKQDLSQQSTVAAQEAQAKIQQSQSEYVRAEFGKMLQNNPTWNDQATFSKDMGSMKTTLVDTYGFAMDEFDNVSDSRIIEVLKDAISYRKGTKFAVKKVVKAPKFQKKAAGKRKPQVSKLDRLTKAARSATGSNKRDLQTAAVAQLLGE